MNQLYIFYIRSKVLFNLVYMENRAIKKNSKLNLYIQLELPKNTNFQSLALILLNHNIESETIKNTGRQVSPQFFFKHESCKIQILNNKNLKGLIYINHIQNEELSLSADYE
ncbi:hypothetical protein pb186bvf_016074 [Paramecium bursaria]